MKTSRPFLTAAVMARLAAGLAGEVQHARGTAPTQESASEPAAALPRPLGWQTMPETLFATFSATTPGAHDLTIQCEGGGQLSLYLSRRPARRTKGNCCSSPARSPNSLPADVYEVRTAALPGATQQPESDARERFQAAARMASDNPVLAAFLATGRLSVG